MYCKLAMIIATHTQINWSWQNFSLLASHPSLDIRMSSGRTASWMWEQRGSMISFVRNKQLPHTLPRYKGQLEISELSEITWLILQCPCGQILYRQHFHSHPIFYALINIQFSEKLKSLGLIWRDTNTMTSSSHF